MAYFFDNFDGPMAIRKRVYRFASSDNGWRFTGGVFVTFKTLEQAEFFLREYKGSILYGGDTLRLKWQAEFYHEKGLFKTELQQK